MKNAGRIKRHAERKLAVQVLYSLAFADPGNNADIRRAYENRPAQMPDDPDSATLEPAEIPAPASGYSWQLVQGVWSNLACLDKSIDRLSTNWRRDRIGLVELAILRLALYELLMEKMESKVVISEAKALCREFDVENAGQLVHGIVDAAAREQKNDRGENVGAEAPA